MTDLPRITIITPSYNQGEYIEQTIQSILDQDYPDLEYWVIDGGSTDSTLDVLHRYDGQLQWVSEPDRGQSHAINKGLEKSSGDVVAFLNSDDTYEPGALLRVGKFFAQHPGAYWLTSKCRTIDQLGKEIRKPITWYKNFWLRTRSYIVLQILNYISQPATFWRREVVEKVGMFDERWQYAMDYDYSLRVGKIFELWFLDEYLANFRVHPTSKAGSSASAQFDIDLQILRAQRPSSLTVRLHKLHNNMIVLIYKALLASSAGM